MYITKILYLSFILLDKTWYIHGLDKCLANPARSAADNKELPFHAFNRVSCQGTACAI